MKIPILLYSASDRYNLGDLLYPIVCQYIFQKLKPNLPIKNYSLTASYQKNIGALQTLSYKALLKELKKTTKKIIYVAGGDGLNCSKNGLYEHKSFWDNIFSRITLKHSYILRAIQKSYWLYRDWIRADIPQFPFHFQKNKSTLVIYNSVGGSRFFSDRQQKVFASAVDYCLVRSFPDYKIFKPNPNINLSPDTITLISELFINPKSLNKIILPNKFIFFQVSNQAFLQNKEKIVNALDSIYEQEKIPFIFCPIGLAYQHEDLKALKEISKKIKAEHILINKPSINDTIYLLSHAALYIGTSLHGSIISMSYGNPYIGMRFIDKVASYLDTWSIEELKGIDDYQDLQQYAHSILHNPAIRPKLANQKKILSQKVHQSFQDILTIITRFENA